MNNREYVNNSGSKCPICESESIIAKGTEFNSGSANVDVECFSCLSTWAEQFKATSEKDVCECGATDLEYNDGESSGLTHYQNVSCVCGKSWINDYSLHSFEMIQENKPTSEKKEIKKTSLESILSLLDTELEKAVEDAEENEGGMSKFLEDLQDSSEFYDEAHADGRVKALTDLKNKLVSLK